jgi:hypothetical protein
MKNRTRVICWLGVVGAIYLSVPFVAGLLGYNDCRGPRIYPMNWHIRLHRIGYEISYATKPRISLTAPERRWFYDFTNFGGEHNR